MAADEKWYFTKEQLTNTPSRRCGIDADKELSYRQQAANFIQDMGQRLVVSQLCINTAIVYMHRFYVFHSLSHFHRNAIAAAALFLAAKVEEQPRKLEHVIKMAHMCLHRDQPPPDVRSEQYLEQAQDLVFNENVLLQTLGFDVAIDHPHTHVVRCCQLVKASKDLAQTSYFMASNSLHLTTMCLQYKPTVVACFCIHLACKWSNWEVGNNNDDFPQNMIRIPQSTEGKHWFWYVDRSVTCELLQELTAEFLHIFDKCPSRLKRKIMSISANQSPSINHPSLPNSPFDAEPRKVQSPATTADGGPTFHTTRPHQTENKDEKKTIPSASTRPPVDYREYREKKERERLEREKASAPTTVSQSHISDIKHQSHHHKPVSSTNVLNKHPLPPGQKALHHNHHHRPDMKVGQPVPQRHSSSTQAREPNRDPTRQRIQREYNSSSGTSSTSSSTLHSHSHVVSKDPIMDNSMTDSTSHRADVGALQEPATHGNMQEKLSNNNHNVHRLSGVENKHQGHDKRMYDPRHKPVEHRKDGEQKPYKYSDPTRVDRQRKSDTLEQRCEEVRKLIEKPLPPPKATLDAPYALNSQKTTHHTKYNQSEKLQTGANAVSNDVKLITSQSSFSQEKSPISTSSTLLLAQKSLTSKTMSNKHTAHGVSQILKDTIKNGSSQSSSITSLNNLDDPKTEKRPRHEDIEKTLSDIQQSVQQTPPPAKPKSLFSPEKVPTPRESHSQRPKTKQKTPPSAAKVPKQERVPDTSIGFNLVSPFASPPGLPQQDAQPVKRSANDVSTTSHKRHRTGSTSEGGQPVKAKLDDTTSFEAAKMLGRVPELIQPIRDNPSANGRATQIANDMKPPELIKPFDSEPSLSRFGTVCSQQQVQSNQQGFTNGLETNLTKHDLQEFQMKKESYKAEVSIKLEHSQVKGDYLSPMKSAQSISALLQEPLAPMPSLLQNMQQFGQITLQQVHQEQHFQQQQLQQQQQQHQHQPAISHSMLLTHQDPVSSQCISALSSVSEPVIVSTVDISALSGPVQTGTESMLPVPTSTTVTVVPPPEEKRSDHHKSEKKKKKEKHKHKDKEKGKDKHKHKHKDKDKEKHREKDKEKGEETVAAVPIKITIPKDKLNLSTESTGSTGGGTVAVDKNKSPQNTSIKIIIPKERLKGTDNVSNSPAQSVVQAPLKIKIRTDGMSRSSGAPSSTGTGSTSIVPEFQAESRKRDRSEMKESPTTSSVPPTKKQLQVSSASYGQHRPGERQNGRHYNSGSNNKVRGGGRGGRQYVGRGPPPAGSAGHYSAAGQRDGYYQQDTYSSNSARNPHHPHPSSARGDPGYSRAGHVNQSQPDSYFFANYPPPSMYTPAGYIYDPVMYYSQYQQQYPMYPTGNMIMTSDGAIDTSVPPPSLPPNMRQNQIMIPVPSARQESKTPPPLPSGPPPSSSPPPPPPPE